jgi:hypothetical protein
MEKSSIRKAGKKWKWIAAFLLGLVLTLSGCWQDQVSDVAFRVDRSFLRGNPSAVSTPDDIKTDAVLLTHAHIDHILDAEPIALGNDVSVVAIGELATYMTGRESRRFQ